MCDEDSPSVCSICGKPLRTGQPVIQIVEDVHPSYDREIVLHTYHRACCLTCGTVTHDCPHCGCRFHLALLRCGEDYQNLSQQLFCPFCATLFDCDMGFDPQPSVGPLSEAALHGLNVDRDLLTRQAALLGKVLNAASLNAEEHSCLGGLWEFVHNVLDLMDGA